MLACQKESSNKLTYIEMENLPAFSKTNAIAIREYKKLESNIVKLNAVKQEIRIHPMVSDKKLCTTHG